MIFAFLRVEYAPFLAMVRRPLVETLMVTVLPSSSTKTRFFWRFGDRLVFPDGLNCVARVRLLYLPPIWVFLPVMSHCFAISGAIVAYCYQVASDLAARSSLFLPWGSKHAKRLHKQNIVATMLLMILLNIASPQPLFSFICKCGTIEPLWNQPRLR